MDAARRALAERLWAEGREVDAALAPGRVLELERELASVGY